MVKVTNISGSVRVLYDKGGKKIELKPKETIEMIRPPEESYAFKIENDHIEKKEKRKEEPKTVRRNG